MKIIQLNGTGEIRGAREATGFFILFWTLGFDLVRRRRVHEVSFFLLKQCCHYFLFDGDLVDFKLDSS